jgi:hypothetical protein
MLTRPRRGGTGRAKDTPMGKPVIWSKTLTFFEGDWHQGNLPIMGPRTRARELYWDYAHAKAA